MLGVGVIVLVLALLIPILILFVIDKDAFPTIPGSKYFVPWQLKTLEFADSRLQFSLSEFAKHGNSIYVCTYILLRYIITGNVFKTVLYGKRVVFLGISDINF